MNSEENKNDMVDVGKEKVYPMSKNMYFGEFYEPRYTFATNRINLLHPINSFRFILLYSVYNNYHDFSLNA
jgi:hypothetical protein